VSAIFVFEQNDEILRAIVTQPQLIRHPRVGCVKSICGQCCIKSCKSGRTFPVVFRAGFGLKCVKMFGAYFGPAYKTFL